MNQLFLLGAWLLSQGQPFRDLVEVMLLLTTFQVTTTDSVALVIQSYRIQSWLLAFVTGLTALTSVLEKGHGSFSVVTLIILMIILPLSLDMFIKRFFVWATIPMPSKLGYTRQEQMAAQEWLKYSLKPHERMRDRIFFIVLIASAFFIAFQIIAGDFQPTERIGLSISLGLYLVGLYNMVVKRDVISQIIGLLVMDHGLYLAVVRIVAVPVPTALFVVSLYFYTLVTLFILVYLLPQVRQFTGTIDLDEISKDSTLEDR